MPSGFEVVIRSQDGDMSRGESVAILHVTVMQSGLDFRGRLKSTLRFSYSGVKASKHEMAKEGPSFNPNYRLFLRACRGLDWTEEGS